MSNTIKNLLDACPRDNNVEWDVDELCSHTFTTLDPKMDRTMAQRSDWEFKIKNVNEEEDKVQIHWFITAGEINEDEPEPQDVTDVLIYIMKQCHLKKY